MRPSRELQTQTLPQLWGADGWEGGLMQYILAALASAIALCVVAGENVRRLITAYWLIVAGI